MDLLFLDLDSFKLINDTWGHQTGDQVLRTAADRLRHIVDASDIVARIGGDEFVVARYVTPGQSRSGETLAADIIDSFRAPLSETESALIATVSVGLVRSTQTGDGRRSAAGRRHGDVPGEGQRTQPLRDLRQQPCTTPYGVRVETELALRHAMVRAAVHAALPADRRTSRPARSSASRR